MHIEGNESEKRIMQEFGKRIAKHRISLQKTQEELAKECGVSRGTIARMEKGESIKFDNLIRVMKVLKISANIDILVPNTNDNPEDLLKLGKQRQRATAKRYRKTPNTDWKWGEDR